MNKKKKREMELIGKGYEKILEDFFIHKEDESLLINNEVYKFNEILSAELKEDGFAETFYHGLGRSNNSFGTMMGSGITEMRINKLDIEIRTNRMSDPFISVRALKLGIWSGFYRKSKRYKNAYNQAQRCLSILQLIISKNKRK